MPNNKDIRCCKCNTKLFEIVILNTIKDDFYILIKCRKCKTINKYNTLDLLNTNNKK